MRAKSVVSEFIGRDLLGVVPARIGSLLDIEILENEYATSPDIDAGDFIQWPTVIELESEERGEMEGTLMLRYVVGILQSFRCSGIKAVPDCDFEDLILNCILDQ